MLSIFEILLLVWSTPMINSGGWKDLALKSTLTWWCFNHFTPPSHIFFWEITAWTESILPPFFLKEIFIFSHLFPSFSIVFHSFPVTAAFAQLWFQASFPAFASPTPTTARRASASRGPRGPPGRPASAASCRRAHRHGHRCQRGDMKIQGADG